MDEENAIKIILLGEAGVGKTNLINVFFGKEFSLNTASTSASYFFDGEYIYNKKKYCYNIWDTAGQEQYRSLNKLFIKNAKIVLLVYAINAKETFEQIDFWVNYVKDILEEGSYIVGLVANKSDLYLQQQVPDEEGEKFAKDHNIKYVITSALSNVEGFKQFINELIEDYINKIENKSDKKPSEKGFSINTNQKLDEQKQKKSCC
jgi:small GTP-binding protein